LTPAQYAVLPVTQYPNVPVSQVPNLDLTRLPNSSSLVFNGQLRVSKQWLASLTPRQIASLNLNKGADRNVAMSLIIPHLPPAQRAMLTKSQIQSLQSFGWNGGLYQALPPTQKSWLTPAQYAVLPLSQYPNVPASQVPKLDLTRLPNASALVFNDQLKVSKAWLSALTPAQITALDMNKAVSVNGNTVPPISAIIPYLPVKQRDMLTKAQIQAIQNFGWANRVYQALSPAQRAWLTPTQRKMLGLLTAAQVGKLNYRSFKLLPQSQLKHVNLSTSQIARLSNYDIATHVPTPVIQAFNRDQVLAISDSVYPSVRVRLTDQQQAWRP
jgi:hypothetical protein